MIFVGKSPENTEKNAFFGESREETQNSIYDKKILMVKREFHSESIHTSDHIFGRCTCDWHVFKQRPNSVRHPVYPRPTKGSGDLLALDRPQKQRLLIDACERTAGLSRRLHGRLRPDPAPGRPRGGCCSDATDLGGAARADFRVPLDDHLRARVCVRACVCVRASRGLNSSTTGPSISRLR